MNIRQRAVSQGRLTMDEATAKRRHAAALTNAARNNLDFIPDKNRRRIVTFRGGAIYSIRPAASLSFLAESHYAPVFLSPARQVRASIGNNTMREFDVPVGALGIVPAGREAMTIWPSRRESIAVVITSSGLADLSEQEYDGKFFELRPTTASATDPWALHIARLLRTELTQQLTASELYIDSIITLFGIHLLRNYSNASGQSRPEIGALSCRNRHLIREFLAENFTSKLSVADLASVCELSPRHFIKAFTKTFGQPPHQYLTKLRLDFAERLLLEGKMTITEVAVLSGFSSQSHLTATLRQHQGVTPAQLRGAL